MSYNPKLDGIRALSVLMVMLFHFGWLGPGWVGVQVFFVLSGYLITGKLLENKGATFGRYLGNFYWRRTLRIFPLYFLFLLVAAAVYIATAWPETFRTAWPWLFTYTTNIGRLFEPDIGMPFTHLWSLAVEEQFYVLWPFVIYFASPRAVRWIIVAIIVASPAARFVLFQSLSNDPVYAGKAVYSLIQLDAFAFGAVIAVWRLEALRGATWMLLALIGLAGALGLAVLAYDHIVHRAAQIWSLGYAHYLMSAYQYVWGYTLLNAIGMLGIIAASQPAFTFLAWRPLVRIGKISYGIYVYHLPLLIAGELVAPDNRIVFFIAWASSVYLVSEASYRLLESRFLALKSPHRQRHTILSFIRTLFGRPVDPTAWHVWDAGFHPVECIDGRLTNGKVWRRKTADGWQYRPHTPEPLEEWRARQY